MLSGYARNEESVFSSALQKAVQILLLEAEAASVAELGRRDRTLSRPATDRLLMYTKVACGLGGPHPDVLTHGISVSECDKIEQEDMRMSECG